MTVKNMSNDNDTISLKEYNDLKSIVLDIKEMVSRLVNEAGKELLTPKEVCEILKIGLKHLSKICGMPEFLIKSKSVIIIAVFM